MKNAISFIISTYDGLPLLKKNLPAVIAEARGGDEILITEDAGPDLTVAHFRAKYNLELVAETDQYRLWRREKSGLSTTKKLTLTVIENKNNLRFGANNNQAAALALHPLIFVLNNDSAPQKNSVKHLVAHFDREQDLTKSQLFAITALEISPFQKNERHGKNQLWFQKGRFMHSKADDWATGPTAWACGGSSLFDRQKFLALGGFDQLYYPAYWEDIDLSYQAQKRGWKVLFEEKAIVHHNHETTNQTVFGQKKITAMSWKNGSKFTWKNGTPAQKLQFLLWQPYWFVKRQPFWVALITILLAAAVIRLTALGDIPSGLTWDEAAIGYNGWAVWQTRRDEWLTRLPISFRSFGDYKAPLGIYFSGAFTTLFGLNPWAIRFGFAASSVFAILGFTLLTRKILQSLKINHSDQLSLLAALFLTLTPWHIFFSRGAWEVGLALTLTIWGAYFLISYFQETPSTKIFHRFWQLLLAVLLFTATFYTYHSSKIFTPLIIITIFFSFKQQFENKRFIPIVLSLLIGAFFLIPFAQDTIYGQGLTRANTSSFLFSSEMLPIEKIMQIGANYLGLLNPAFLSFGYVGDNGYAHSTQNGWGVLLLPVFILSCLGLILGFYFSFKKRPTPLKKLFRLSLLWIFFGLLPAAITMDIPHAVRGFLALPGFLLLSIFALAALIELRSRRPQSQAAVSILLTTLIIEIIFGAGYLHHYFTAYPAQAGTAYNAGALEVAALAASYEDQVDHILFTNEYGHAYLYSLIATQTNPYWWQGGDLMKYEFSDQINPLDLTRHNNLVVIGQKELAEFPLDSELLVDEVRGPANEIRYRLYLTPSL